MGSVLHAARLRGDRLAYRVLGQGRSMARLKPAAVLLVVVLGVSAHAVGEPACALKAAQKPVVCRSRGATHTIARLRFSGAAAPGGSPALVHC